MSNHLKDVGIADIRTTHPTTVLPVQLGIWKNPRIDIIVHNALNIPIYAGRKVAGIAGADDGYIWIPSKRVCRKSAACYFALSVSRRHSKHKTWGLAVNDILQKPV